jgi:surface polysaccharide O-acyltransferase-like enzyme
MKPATDNGSARLHYLDWLRLGAILSVFVLHSAKVFAFHTSTVYNAERSLALTGLREFILLWVMPLFFVISGASVYFSLRSRQTSGFVRERVVRILVPLALVGTFVIAPVYVYVEKLFDGKTVEGFFRWYPHFFEGWWPGGNFAPLGYGTHLWYLLYLFLFSLILLPLFLRRKKTGMSRLARWSRHFDRPWAIFMLFVPIAVSSAIIEFAGLGGIRVTGGWDFLSYIFFFMFGYVLFANQRALESIQKYAFWSVGAAAGLTVFYLGTRYGMGGEIPGLTRYNVSSGYAVELPYNLYAAVGMQFLRGLIGWLWVIGLVGLGRRFLKSPNRVLAYSREATLPFYILHHAVIYLVAYYVIQWNQSVGLKFFALLAISFVAIMVPYELVVRRVNVLRFLFGMKIRGRIWGVARQRRASRKTALADQNASTPATASR